MTDEDKWGGGAPGSIGGGNGGAEPAIRIKVVGVGGAGGNAVDRLHLDGFSGAGLAVVNTDLQSLNSSPVEEKLLLGRAVTRGLSAGGDAVVGERAAEADRDALRRLAEGVDLLFILAGMGGGNGSGAAPVLAEVAVEAGAVVIAFVTLPFTFEGEMRFKQAEGGLVALRERCHAVVPLPNDLIMQQLPEEASVLDAFSQADEWVSRGVRSINSMLARTGLINVDFATLKNALRPGGGKTLYGLGLGSGPDCAGEALRDLSLCPLLHTPEFSRRADTLVVNLEGGPDLSIAKVHEVMGVITEQFGSKANTVLGAVIDGAMSGELRICVLGTTDIDARAARPLPARGRAGRPVEPPAFDPGNRSAVVRPGATAAADLAANRPVHTSKLQADAASRLPQVEFDFGADPMSRGFFEQTESSLYDGEDLDVPTYLRRGVKVQISK